MYYRLILKTFLQTFTIFCQLHKGGGGLEFSKIAVMARGEWEIFYYKWGKARNAGIGGGGEDWFYIGGR